MSASASDPDIDAPSLPDFVLDKVPMVRLRGGEWKRRPSRDAQGYSEPRYDHPFFQDAFRELNALLAAELDGNPLVEYMDTFMYGFWGEGHTWPFTDHPFPDGATAERTRRRARFATEGDAEQRRAREAALLRHVRKRQIGHG